MPDKWMKSKSESGFRKEISTMKLSYILAGKVLYNQKVMSQQLGPPREPQNPAFTQVFCTNHAKILPEIRVHAKFTQSRWMPDWFFTQSRNYFHSIPIFTLWNMLNHAITLSPWGAPSRYSLLTKTANTRFSNVRAICYVLTQQNKDSARF